VTELRKIAGLCLGSSVLVDEYLSFAGRGNLAEIVREWQTRLSLPGGSIVVTFNKLAEVIQEQPGPSPVSGWRVPMGSMFTRLGEGELEDTPDSSRSFDETDVQSSTKLVGTVVAEINRVHHGVPELVMLAHRLWLTALGLLHAVKFDRVAVLVVDYQKGQLCRGAVFGRQPSPLDSYERPIAESSQGATVEILACRDRRAVFGGKPICSDGGQACAFPLMDAEGVRGVVYAERVGPSASLPLGLDHKMAVTAFAECWQQ
jgi:hypothetical protein